MVRNFTFTLILFIFCSIGLKAQQTLVDSILHNGIYRNYILYVPASYTPNAPVPLVMNFHGLGSNAFAQLNYGDFRGIADTANFLAVHPQGTKYFGNNHWNVGGFTAGSTVDDVGFSAALIDSLSASYSIDSTRVYATGMSNGGFFSFLLACQLSNRIAAVASVTGSMTPANFNNCSPQHAMPVLQFHGTADGTVPYNGNFFGKPISDVLQYWAAFDSASLVPTITALPDINTTDQSTVEHYVYGGGRDGTVVEHYKITGGGHTWPGNSLITAGTNYDINASTLIWEFFSRYDINGAMVVANNKERNLAENKVTVYPNPSKGLVTVRTSAGKDHDYFLLNTLGQVVNMGRVNEVSTTIDLSVFPTGVYFLKIGVETHKVMLVD